MHPARTHLHRAVNRAAGCAAGGEHRLVAGQLPYLQVSGRAEVSMDMSKDELYRKAKEAGIEGRSKMTNDELVRALTR